MIRRQTASPADTTECRHQILVNVESVGTNLYYTNFGLKFSAEIDEIRVVEKTPAYWGADSGLCGRVFFLACTSSER